MYMYARVVHAVVVVVCPRSKNAYHMGTRLWMWRPAAIFCEGVNGYLARIDDEAEYKKLQNIWDEYKLNITDYEKDFVWVDGSYSTEKGSWTCRSTKRDCKYVNWADGQSENHNTKGYCRALRFGETEGMVDVPCISEAPYICEI